MKLTKEQLRARCEALEECADHLDLDWTDDPVERAEGNKLADRLRKESLKWARKAAALK